MMVEYESAKLTIATFTCPHAADAFVCADLSIKQPELIIPHISPIVYSSYINRTIHLDFSSTAGTNNAA